MNEPGNPWGLAGGQVRRRVWDQVIDQVANRVGIRVVGQAKGQVWGQVRDQVKVCIQVGNQTQLRIGLTKDQAYDQLLRHPIASQI